METGSPGVHPGRVSARKWVAVAETQGLLSKLRECLGCSAGLQGMWILIRGCPGRAYLFDRVCTLDLLEGVSTRKRSLKPESSSSVPCFLGNLIRGRKTTKDISEASRRVQKPSTKVMQIVARLAPQLSHILCFGLLEAGIQFPQSHSNPCWQSA